MGADETMRSLAGGLPGADLAAAATVAPALADARVAIVTTAGLTVDEVRLWGLTDASFVELPSDPGRVRLSHFSPNFDRSGLAADPNVVFPVDRLQEMADDGTIGSVNHRHLAFMGAQFDLSTIVADTGPAAARLLRDDGVDVVLLTPV
jgi:D-proline reductase (dithiol) PrdB